ncbi:hypothetical protein [Pseudanabaena sp. PCC 6802]|uniref:hypothetical protein n=1 Tax=Pseudanabaena sp. PCC 6802 TaxID=118173 RepID=UPI000347F2CB|nr:hypothetical protein [Pseudanabaena sp. PCC 6802]
MLELRYRDRRFPFPDRPSAYPSLLRCFFSFNLFPCLNAAHFTVCDGGVGIGGEIVGRSLATLLLQIVVKLRFGYNDGNSCCTSFLGL